MKVYFSHGKESGPWGSKIQKLASIASEHGCTVDSIDYTDLMDPDQRVERLRLYCIKLDLGNLLKSNTTCSQIGNFVH